MERNAVEKAKDTNRPEQSKKEWVSSIMSRTSATSSPSEGQPAGT